MKVLTWVNRPPAKLTADRVCVLRKSAKVDQADIDHGAQYLDRFEAVVCQTDLDESLIQIVPEQWRKAVGERVPSLRVPVYTCDVLWLQRNERTAALLDLWRELDTEYDGQYKEVALTVALYQSRLMTWYLPPAGIKDDQAAD